MNWDAVGAVAESLGALGVIATLIYLAIQVKHSQKATEANTRQIRGQAFVQLHAAHRQLLTWLREHDKEFQVLSKAMTGKWSELSAYEKRLAYMWNAEEAGYYELAFMLWLEGALEEVAYLSREEYWVSCLLEPGRREWWDTQSSSLEPRFIARIDERLVMAEKSGAESAFQKFPMFLET
jgi:hypothetical protein